MDYFEILPWSLPHFCKNLMRDELERNHKEINVLLGSFYTRSTAIKHDNAFLSSTPYASPLPALSLSTFVKPQVWLNPFLAIYQCSRSTPRRQTVIATPSLAQWPWSKSRTQMLPLATHISLVPHVPDYHFTPAPLCSTSQHPLCWWFCCEGPWGNWGNWNRTFNVLLL